MFFVTHTTPRVEEKTMENLKRLIIKLIEKCDNVDLLMVIYELLQ